MNKEEIKKFILAQRKEDKLVYYGLEELISVKIEDFIKQPVDGILYDLNRLEEISLTFLDDPKWINDFAVALTIRELYRQLEQLKKDCASFQNQIDQRKTYKAHDES